VKKPQTPVLEIDHFDNTPNRRRVSLGGA
jgi:hypothetical protein